jgi:hypothetical protein
MNPLRWRKMTWVLNIWNVLFLIWIIAASASSEGSCDTPEERGGLSKEACEAASDVGTGLGITLILILWFLGFIVLALIWLMSRPKHRTCPHCGSDVKKGRTTCKNCGFDFTIGGKPPAEAEAPT